MSVFAPPMASKTRRHHPWLAALGSVLLGIIALIVLGAEQQPTPVTCTGPACTAPPPSAPHVANVHHYTSSAYGYSVEYSTENIEPSQQDSSTIAWDGQLNNGDEITWSFTGVHPGTRSAQQLVNDAQSNNFPDASFAYTIPGADLGYTPGYGNVYDLSAASGSGAAVHERLIIIAAIKNNAQGVPVGVVFVGLGPYQQTTPNTDGHPNPAQTPLVDLGDVEETLTSVTWPGEPAL